MSQCQKSDHMLYHWRKIRLQPEKRRGLGNTFQPSSFKDHADFPISRHISQNPSAMRFVVKPFSIVFRPMNQFFSRTADHAIHQWLATVQTVAISLPIGNCAIVGVATLHAHIAMRLVTESSYQLSIVPFDVSNRCHCSFDISNTLEPAWFMVFGFYSINFFRPKQSLIIINLLYL